MFCDAIMTDKHYQHCSSYIIIVLFYRCCQFLFLLFNFPCPLQSSQPFVKFSFGSIFIIAAGKWGHRVNRNLKYVYYNNCAMIITIVPTLEALFFTAATASSSSGSSLPFISASFIALSLATYLLQIIIQLSARSY